MKVGRLVNARLTEVIPPGVNLYNNVLCQEYHRKRIFRGKLLKRASLNVHFPPGRLAIVVIGKFLYNYILLRKRWDMTSVKNEDINRKKDGFRLKRKIPHETS
jgi:hypothetical protein